MKRKVILLGSLFVVLLMISGCGKNEAVKTMVCESTATQGDVKLNLHYTVTYQGSYVKTVDTKEVLTSDSEATLKGYKEAVENIYKNYDNIDYYDYHIELKDKTLTSTVSIDYEHIDTDKLIKIEDSTEQLIKNGKVNIEDLKAIYEEVGATCKVQD